MEVIELCQKRHAGGMQRGRFEGIPIIYGPTDAATKLEFKFRAEDNDLQEGRERFSSVHEDDDRRFR